MGKQTQLTQRQVELVNKMVSFLRYWDELFPDGDENDLEVFGPPEAYYPAQKEWSQQP